MRGVQSPDIAEAIGIREALKWVKESGHHNVCLQMVQAIRSSFVCYSYLGRVITDCRTALESLCRKNIKLSFVRRSANKVAQSCSKADRVWRVGDVHSDFHILSEYTYKILIL